MILMMNTVQAEDEERAAGVNTHTIIISTTNWYFELKFGI